MYYIQSAVLSIYLKVTCPKKYKLRFISCVYLAILSCWVYLLNETMTTGKSHWEINRDVVCILWSWHIFNLNTITWLLSLYDYIWPILTWYIFTKHLRCHSLWFMICVNTTIEPPHMPKSREKCHKKEIPTSANICIYIKHIHSSSITYIHIYIKCISMWILEKNNARILFRRYRIHRYGLKESVRVGEG